MICDATLLAILAFLSGFAAASFIVLVMMAGQIGKRLDAAAEAEATAKRADQ